MTRTTKQERRLVNEVIDVSVFRDIQIYFPGDVYILATWLAMSDRAKSTPTAQRHTTLHGLARHFASLHCSDVSNPLSSEDVMAVFRRHGISGNPLLRLEATADVNLSLLAMGNTAGRLTAPIATIAERQGCHSTPSTE